MTLNINGLQKKVANIENLVKNEKVDILLMQETHKINKRKFNQKMNELNYEVFYNTETHQSGRKNFNAGTLVLLKQTLLHKYTLSHKIIEKNRIQTITLTNDTKTTHITNVYLTAGNTSTSIKARMNQIKQLLHGLTDIIIAGDLTNEDIIIAASEIL